MQTLSFNLKLNFSGPSADDCIDELQKASTGEKYDPPCYGFYSDTNVHPQAVIREEGLAIKYGCESLKGLITHLQSSALDSFKSMSFYLELTGDVNDVIKDKYQIQLPNADGNISSRLIANDMVTLRTTLVEIDQIADKILATL